MPYIIIYSHHRLFIKGTVLVISAANSSSSLCEFHSPDIGGVGRPPCRMQTLLEFATLNVIGSQTMNIFLCWIFYKSLSNYDASLRIMQHVMLTFAPYSCFILQYPEERMDRKRERERKRWHEGSFWVSLSPWKTNMKTEMWQIPAMSESSGLSHVLICQVRKCFGSVGGEVRSCFLPVHVWWMCRAEFLCTGAGPPCAVLSHRLVIQASMARKFFLYFYSV